MKKITFLMLFVMAGLLAQGQYFYIPNILAGQNPGGINVDDEYPVGGGIPAGWTTIVGPSNTTPIWSTTQTLPFAFSFNGTPVTTYKVSTSGVLTFDVATALPAPTYTNAAIPNAAIPNNSLCVWGVAGTGSNDNIVVKNFGTAPNRQHWVTFSSYTGETGASGWQYWSIVVEETTNKVYFVDQRFSGTAVSLTVGIQVSATSAFSVAASPNVVSYSTNNAGVADNSFYEFIPGTQVAYDVWTKTLNLNPILGITNAPFTIAGLLTNVGSTALTSLDLSYSVNGGAPVTANLTGLSIAAYGNYNYSHPQTWTPAAIGNYVIKVWASNLNGNPDLNNSNDTVTKAITVVAQIVPRLTLHESFTSSTCAPCVPGNQNLAAIFAANPNKYTCIKYQMSWPSPGDPYFTTEGETRRFYYAVSSVPQLWVDGGLGINTSGYSQAQFNAAFNKPAFVTMTATSTILLPKTVNINLSIAPVADVTSTNLVLHTAIFEYLTHNNTGSNGETSFNYVMKKMLPDASGTPLAPLVNGVTVPITKTYTFNGNYRLPANANSPINHAIEHSVEEFSDLGVIMWIQDNVTKEVYQSCFATITVGTGDVTNNDGIIGLFPNPANSQANIHYFMKEDGRLNLDIYNMMGQKVYNLEKASVPSGQDILTTDTGHLPGGVYIVHLTLGKHTYTTKMNITR